MPAALNKKFVKNYLFEKGFLTLEEYKKSQEKIKSKCLRCEKIVEIRYNDISQGHGCSFCAGVKKKTLKYIQDFFKEMNIEVLSKEYINSGNKLDVYCLICKNVWKTSYQNASKPRGCPKCAIKKRRETFKKKYGVEHAMHVLKIALKVAKSTNNSHNLKHWKSGKELVCVGSYEKKVVEYLNKNKIDFWWQEYIFFIPNGSSYTPDLYLIDEDKWIEIKGYFRPDAKEKWKWFCENRRAELWDRQKLKEMNIL